MNYTNSISKWNYTHTDWNVRVKLIYTIQFCGLFHWELCVKSLCVFLFLSFSFVHYFFTISTHFQQTHIFSCTTCIGLLMIVVQYNQIRSYTVHIHIHMRTSQTSIHTQSTDYMFYWCLNNRLRLMFAFWAKIRVVFIVNIETYK